jgi:hypothetical protein
MADYNVLRAQTLGSAQEEEAVTVNTRALVILNLRATSLAPSANKGDDRSIKFSQDILAKTQRIRPFLLFPR